MATIVSLVGARCSGKTSTGRELARRLGWAFADLDEEIARGFARERGLAEAPEAGRVLEEVGEAAFRDREERALREVLGRGGPTVLATGGGVVERAASRALLARRTTCVWLQVGAAELARRMRGDPAPRPSLTGGDPVGEIGEVLARREPWYGEVAEVRIDCRGLGIGEVAEEAASRIGRGSRRGCRG